MIEVLNDSLALWDGIALIETEAGLEHRLAKPNSGKSVQQSLVVIVSDASSVLNLSWKNKINDEKT